MKIIDIDKMFEEYLTEWLAENANRGLKEEELETRVPDVYIRFINERRPEFNDLSPSEYFAGFNDVYELTDGMVEYENAGIEPPQIMLDRIIDMGEQAVKPLMLITMDEDKGECLRVTALNMLISIGSDLPMGYCLTLVDAREDDDALADVAAELLESLGQKPVAAMLDRLETASSSAICTYLDLLCNFPGDERIYIYMMREFITNPPKRALYASLLGKLGDERAIKALTAALDLPDVNYLDYMEIRNSLEMLGADVKHVRDFDGDKYYETLKDLDDGE